MAEKPLFLKVFDVGHGDCILVTFPNDEMGLIDSNTMNETAQCPAIPDILNGSRRLRFLCLTHPHDDHYRGMLSVLKHSDITVDAFWHPMSLCLEDVLHFFNERFVPYYRDVPFVSRKMRLESGELLDIFEHLENNKSTDFTKRIGDFQKLDSVGGVNVISLGPSHNFSNRYEKRLKEAIKQTVLDEKIKVNRNHANAISIVLMFEYGESKVILGGDALRGNWKAIRAGADRKKAAVDSANCFKVSHHGSKNCFYYGMWDHFLADKGVLIVSSGNPGHPSADFIRSTKERWSIFCTNKGRHCSSYHSDSTVTWTARHWLDRVSRSPDGSEKCCSNIEIEILRNSDVKVSYATTEQRSCGR